MGAPVLWTGAPTVFGSLPQLLYDQPEWITDRGRVHRSPDAHPLHSRLNLQG
jgi:hypothetical protein